MDIALIGGATPGCESHCECQHIASARAACALLSGCIFASLVSLGLAAYYSSTYPALLSHACLASMLGLRHAVDCDHLAVIDNFTCQFINRGERPVSIGFWFAVGHSTIVVALTGFIASGYSMAWKHSSKDSGWSENIALLASIISITLLGGIGILNARVAIEQWIEWSRMRTHSRPEQEDAEKEAAESALRTALTTVPFLKRAFSHVDKPRKMYWVGLLFGLSFDTATQVGLIGRAAMASTTGAVPASIVIVIPICFSTGMCLVDTGNGFLMLLAHSWATVSPTEKLFYNILVTALSAFVALVIGSLETLQIVTWDELGAVDMASLGFFIIIVFAVILLLSLTCTFAHHCCQSKHAIDVGHHTP